MSHSNDDEINNNENSLHIVSLFFFLRLVPLRWRSLTPGEVLCLLDIRLRPPAVDWWPPWPTDCRKRVVSMAWWQRVPLEDRCVTLQNQQSIYTRGNILITLSCMCVAGSCYGDRSLSSVTLILPQTVTHGFCKYYSAVVPWNVHELFIIRRFLIWNDAWDTDVHVNVAFLEKVIFCLLNIALKTGQLYSYTLQKRTIHIWFWNL